MTRGMSETRVVWQCWSAEVLLNATRMATRGFDTRTFMLRETTRNMNTERLKLHMNHGSVRIYVVECVSDVVATTTMRLEVVPLSVMVGAAGKICLIPRWDESGVKRGSAANIGPQPVGVTGSAVAGETALVAYHLISKYNKPHLRILSG